MSNKSDYFFYDKRYLNGKERNHLLHNYIKGKLLRFIISKKKFFKSLQIWEVFTNERKTWLKPYNIFVDSIHRQSDSFYSEINLKTISLFEVIDIDDFNHFRKTILSRFSRPSGLWQANTKRDLIERLEGVETKFDNISKGFLFDTTLKSSNPSNRDLIKLIDCSYIKTNESYFIIQIDIHLSEKGQSIVSKILQQRDSGISFPMYNSYTEILRRRKFYYAEQFGQSLKAFCMENFISDLNSQIKMNVTKYFKGHFHDSKVLKNLPSIQLFEVSDINDFKKDSNSRAIYETRYSKFYALADDQIEVHFNDSWSEDYEVFKIVKQKEHGIRNASRGDLSDYDMLENINLIDSLAFPCVFSAILRLQVNKLNRLKRQIYDQIKISENSLLRNFFLVGVNRRYLRLKHISVQILLTIKRFEDEFTERNLRWYSNEKTLSLFHVREGRSGDEGDLMTYIVKTLQYQMDNLEQKTKSLNEVFKSLEEYNSYMTNFILQLFSVIITVLAFIFAFDKTKDLFAN